MSSDLRNATYDEIVAFVFDRYPEDEVDDKWYWNLAEDVQIQPDRAVAFLTRLCTTADLLIEEYTLPQIAEGVHYLFGAGGSDQFMDHLWNPAIPWPDRRACIRSIPNLYTAVFERDPEGVGGCAYMLWDSIAYGYHAGTRDPATSAEDARVQDAMFEALTSMLRSEHPETLRGAIHGLGHLHHRHGSRAIHELLASDRQLGSALRTYAGHVLEGHFQ